MSTHLRSTMYNLYGDTGSQSMVGMSHINSDIKTSALSFSWISSSLNPLKLKKIVSEPTVVPSKSHSDVTLRLQLLN